jgi:general secretion pathway protein K
VATAIGVGGASGTSGVLLAEPSELRAIGGVTPQFYARLRPFLCALPTTELSPINVNALTREQAPLVAMLGGGKLTREAAARIIAERPPGGWTDLETFWNAFAALDISPDEPVRAQAQVRGRFYAVESEATFADAEAIATSLLERQQDGAVRLVARRWGRAE